MARNGSGVYNLLTNSWNPATNGVSATAVDWQNLINDVAAALTQSLSADGQTPMTGNLNAGNNKITGLAAGTSSGQSIRWEQVFTAPASFGGGAINVDASGNVGIGTTVPISKAHISAVSADALGVYRDLDVGTAGAAATFINLGARSGTTFTPGATLIGVLDNPATSGYYEIQTRTAGALTTKVRVNSDGNVGVGTTTPGTRLDVAGGFTSDFWRGRSNGSTPTADCAVYRPADNTLGFSTANTERARIDTSGNLLLTSASGGLGYGAGSGGTVTQATSKSTTVTLNRPSGRITMNNAALAANTEVAFTLLNSLITSLADIVLPQIDGQGSYSVRAVTDLSVGGVVIIVRNNTGFSRSDSPIINFVVIKGSTT